MVIVRGIFRAIICFYVRLRVSGRDQLDGLEGPVVLVATHASHMDTPMLLGALPRAWGRRTVVAAAADYFYASRPLARTVSLAFGTVPIERHGGGLAPGAGGPVPALLGHGWSLVMFAEGTRSRDGSVGRLRSGAAVLAADHGCPILPVRLSGTHAAMPPGRGWPRRIRASRLVRRRHPAEIRFGAPIHIGENESRHEVMERVRLALAPDGELIAREPPPVREQTLVAPGAP
jgi:1-acyl-sn-glycerol-3-phosphate acyltransferase